MCIRDRVSVDENSPSDVAGIQPGDIITRVGTKKCTNPEQFQRLLSDTKKRNMVMLHLKRDGAAIEQVGWFNPIATENSYEINDGMSVTTLIYVKETAPGSAPAEAGRPPAGSRAAAAGAAPPATVNRLGGGTIDWSGAAAASTLGASG